MGAKNIERLLAAASGEPLLDPGDAGTISVTEPLKVSSIITAGAETRTLAVPPTVGLLHTIYLKTDGGTLTLTVTGGYDQAANTTMTFSDVGDYALFQSIDDNGTLRWQVVHHVSGSEVVVTETTQYADNLGIQFGTGSDVSVNWNGTYMEGNAAANAMWDNCPSKLDPNYLATSYEVVDDFISTPDVTNLWTAANVGSGTTTYDPAVAGGVLLLTCQATTDDAAEQLTHKGAGFLLAAGKTLWYETRLKLVGDSQSEVSFGLVADGEDLTAVADVFPNDGVSFSSQDASLAGALTCSKNGTNTGAVAGVTTMVSGTYVKFGFVIDGTTSVTPYIDGVAGTAATATINDDEAMAPYFLVRNGDSSTQQVMHVDYVRVVQLR